MQRHGPRSTQSSRTCERRRRPRCASGRSPRRQRRSFEARPRRRVPSCAGYPSASRRHTRATHKTHTARAGHHASRYAADGFCLYNFCAGAAAHALEEKGVDWVAILDWDAHHGNGLAAYAEEEL